MNAETPDILKARAAEARMKYLKIQAELHGLPLNEHWDEARVREEFRKYGIPQSGIKPNGQKSDPPTKKVASPQQTTIKFDDSVDFENRARMGSIENNIPFVTREQRDRMLQAQKPKLDPYLSVIQVGQSFQVQLPWNKGVAMTWAARVKKHRETLGLTVNQFDVRTAPDPKNPKYSRVWRTV